MLLDLVYVFKTVVTDFISQAMEMENDDETKPDYFIIKDENQKAKGEEIIY